MNNSEKLQMALEIEQHVYNKLVGSKRRGLISLMSEHSSVVSLLNTDESVFNER